MTYPYFFLGLILAFLACLFLLLLLFTRLRINRAQENRHRYSFILPALITGLFLLLAVFELRPRILDTIAILDNSLYHRNIDSSEISLKAGKLYLEDEVLVLGPYAQAFDGQSLYRLRYAPHTNIVLGTEKMTTSSPDLEENLQQIR